MPSRFHRHRNRAFRSHDRRCHYCGVAMWLAGPNELPGIDPQRHGVEMLKATAEHLQGQSSRLRAPSPPGTSVGYMTAASSRKSELASRLVPKQLTLIVSVPIWPGPIKDRERRDRGPVIELHAV
jgi:hypothetical protein